MSFWTIEEVSEFLDITVSQVYESRRRKEYPGVLGKQRGRRLMFDQASVEAGPQEDYHTTDIEGVALIWALEGIHKTLRLIEKNTRPTYLTGYYATDTIEGEEE